MSVPTFTRASEVKAGDLITSAQYVKLARAFNDRLRLLGDLSWRLSWYWFNLWRQVRNPDASGYLFPPQSEWDEIYAHIDPDYTSIEWPVAAPGEAEGANLGSAMMAYVFGTGTGDNDEPSRITLPMAAPTTPRDYWALGKHQRGTYDAVTGAQNAPAFDAAISVFAFGWNSLVPHHKSYGGWAPMPVEIAGDCGPSGDPGAGIPDYGIKFTALNSAAATASLHGTITATDDGLPVVTYAGTCPCGSAGYASGHVQQIVRHPLYYIVYVGTGDPDCGTTTDYLSTRDWVEGPNEGAPYLTHQDGGQIHRAAWAAHADFRGSAAQRSGDDWITQDVAFDNQAFFTRQYPLAPARGRLIGGMLQAEYPKASARLEAAGLIPEGTYLAFAARRFQYRVETGFVISGLLATSTGLKAAVAVDVLDGDTRIAGFVLTPGEPDVLRWLPTAVAATTLKVRLLQDAVFGAAGGTIDVEFAELLAWKPYYWDAMACTRNAGSRGGGVMTAGVDGRGVDCEIAPQIVTDLHKYGCLLNPDATAPRPQADWVNDNPIYDAARRLTRAHVRRAGRRQFVGYEVADGKSILYFKRFAWGLRRSRLDMWDGIAPPLDPVVSGELLEGETYLVRGTTGYVTYRGQSVRPGATFTASAVVEFAAHGDCAVYVHDGIRHSARKGGSTNEWVLNLETHCYHPSVSSNWKPDAYSDYWPFNNRCLFYPWTAPGAVRRHVSFNHQVEVDGDDYSLSRLPMSLQATLYSPEAPSSYSYAAGTNALYADEDFCRSCQIWTAPYEIESCTVDDWADDQVIKITLTGRLRSDPSAPATVARDVSTWTTGDVDDLRAEAYRTDDNAVREYVRHQYDGAYHCSQKVGDAGANSQIWTLPDNPFGSCYPNFLFAHLIPEPYEDGNSVSESWDTRATTDAFLQMETMLRAICEAFVDGRTTADVVCRTGVGGLYDYTYENLCHDAFGGRWIGAFGLDVRPDGEPGFGPLPNSVMYADVFNRLARAVNLLTRIRVDLPLVISSRRLEGTSDTTPEIEPSGAGCSTTGDVMAWADKVTVEKVPDSGLVAGPWEASSAFEASQVSTMLGCPFAVTTTRNDVEWKIEPETVFLEALPAWLDEAFDLGQITLAAKIVTHTVRQTRQAVSDPADGDACCDVGDLPCPGHWTNGAGKYYRWIQTEANDTRCLLTSPGIITAGRPPTSDYAIGRDSGMGAGIWCGPIAEELRTVTLFPDTAAVEFQLTAP